MTKSRTALFRRQALVAVPLGFSIQWQGPIAQTYPAESPSYQGGVSAGELRLDRRGPPVTLSHGQDATTLVFRVPSLGIDESFTGATRNASPDRFDGCSNQNGNDILRELLHVSAIDALGGNPTRIQGQMAAGDFAAGVDPVYDALRPGGSFAPEASFGNYSTGQFNRNAYTLPLSYVHTFAN